MTSIRRVWDSAGLIHQLQRSYVAWDDLRRKALPRGVKAEDLWGCLDWFRRWQSLTLPLQDSRDATLRVWWSHEQVVEDLLTIEALARDPLGLMGREVTPARALEYGREILADEAIESSLLEGAPTTRRDALAMLRRGTPPRHRGERMVLNNYRAMRLIEDRLKEPLCRTLIEELHRTISEGTLRDPEDEGRIQGPGDTRAYVYDEEEGRAVHTPPPAEALPERIKLLCAFANADEPSLPAFVKGAILHFQLAYEHPFADGNGRTARALFYWYVRRRGYDLFRYLSLSQAIRASPAQYYRAFIHSEQTGDLTYFVLYYMKVVREAIDRLGRFVRRKIRSERDSASMLRRWPALGLRQRLLVMGAVKDPHHAFTATGVIRTFEVSRPTALRDLAGLVELGLLHVTKVGKELHYRPIPDLEARLASGPVQEPAGGA
ncbi:MAG: Fic family protein [Planctomycetes bacterium]|nr:Fic family protein [Planctomycetota bacterium]